MKLQHVLAAVQATPWAILPEKFAEIMGLLELRAGGHRLTKGEIRARIGAGPRRDPYQAGTIAVLPIHGVIAHRMDAMMEMSGGTSTEQLARKFDALVADPSIAAIVLDVDSPGGAVDGTPELAQHIHASRGQKPIVAISNGLMASAAYYIASAADEVVASPSSLTGSIGVIAAHVDASKFYDEAGLKITLISAGKYKTEGTDTEPLGDEAREHLQEMVDDAYDQFVRAVAKHRSASIDEVRGGFGEARVLTAKRAVKAGLADRVATLDQVLAELAGGKGKRSRLAAVIATPALSDSTSNTGLAAGALSVGTYTPSDFSLLVTPAGEDAGADAEPLAAAPEAKEQAMPEKDTAAHPENGAAPKTPAAADPAPLTREAALAELAEAHNVPVATLNTWVREGTSVKQASREILAGHAERNHQIPTGAPAPITRVTDVRDRAADRQFTSMGEQLQAVISAGKGRGVDPRLVRINHEAMRLGAAVSGMHEGLGDAGGFFIEPMLIPGFMEPIYKADPFLSRVQRITLTTNATSVRLLLVDETARTNGNRWGGVQVYWVGEADTATPSRPKMRPVQIDVNKLMGICYLTEELANDAPATAGLVERAFGTEILWTLTAAVWRGNGVGQPLGFINSGALISQAIEGTQTIANTENFISKNVAKMLSRVASGLSPIWFYQADLLPALIVSTVNANSHVPVWMAGQSLTEAPNDRILGRAAFESEFADVVGTVSDFVLADPSQYLVIDKGGIGAATSMHVRFLNDEQTLKWTYRVGGMPLWHTPFTPFKGNTRSPFVALAGRS